ncbi:hypothetical protein WJX72_010322 [[Myrmecia] bisecta]|uniref:Uncharacterized protein n=1 Tax=[Myrmecia] bisecta TaxID=41462 RepID=A0AAW1PB12_9CHLO
MVIKLLADELVRRLGTQAHIRHREGRTPIRLVVLFTSPFHDLIQLQAIIRDHQWRLQLRRGALMQILPCYKFHKPLGRGKLFNYGERVSTEQIMELGVKHRPQKHLVATPAAREAAVVSIESTLRSFAEKQLGVDFDVPQPIYNHWLAAIMRDVQESAQAVPDGFPLATGHHIRITAAVNVDLAELRDQYMLTYRDKRQDRADLGSTDGEQQG